MVMKNVISASYMYIKHLCKYRKFSTCYGSHQENDHFCTTYKEVIKLYIILAKEKLNEMFCFMYPFFKGFCKRNANKNHSHAPVSWD